MRVDTYANLIIKNGKYYLTNLRTGAADLISENLFNKIKILQEKVSFSDEECIISDKELNQLIDKGYITSFSDNDLVKSVDYFFNSHLQKLKNSSKTLSIVLDNIIGKKWCKKGENNIVNNFMQFNDFEKIIKRMAENELFESINLWFDEKNEKVDLSDIIKCAKSHKINIAKIYYTTSSKESINNIKDQIKKLKLNTFQLNVKLDNENNKHLSYLYNNKNNSFIESVEVLHCKDDYLFCPFMYNTFFINYLGEGHYCVSKVYDGQSIYSDFFKKVNKDNWSDNLFKIVCDEKKINCSFSIYCTSSCQVLNKITFNGKEPNKCEVASKINAYNIDKVLTLDNSD